MRKLLVIAGFVFSTAAAFGQKLDDVKKDISGNKYADAKTKIDQLLADPKNASSSDLQFYKAVVYQNLAKEKGDSALSVAALQAMQSYVKMEEAKPDAQRGLLSTLENNKTMVDIYQGYFSRGVDNFKNKSYVTAHSNFVGALDAFDLLMKRNITTVKFDTTVNLYAGYSAQNAKMYDEAAKYYDRLIGININDSSYVDIYRFMINNNLEKKDTAAAKKYLQLSQTRYPQYGDIWLDYQTLFLPNNKTTRFDEYAQLVKANPKNEALALNYAIELYNNLRSSEGNEKDPAMRQRAEDALKNVLAVNANSTTGNLLISQLYWTELYDYQAQLDAVRGATPAATAKKKDLNAKMDATFEKVLPYLTKSYDLYSAQTTLKPQDKANYRIVLGQLSDYYNRKKQADKAATYQAKLKTL